MADLSKKYQMWKKALEERQADASQMQVFESMMVFIGEQQREINKRTKEETLTLYKHVKQE